PFRGYILCVSSLHLSAKASLCENPGQFLACPKEQNTNALFFKSQDAGNLPMLHTLHVREPQQLPFQRFELLKNPPQVTTQNHVASFVSDKKAILPIFIRPHLWSAHRPSF